MKMFLHTNVANFIFATYLHQANLGQIQFFIQCKHVGSFEGKQEIHSHCMREYTNHVTSTHAPFDNFPVSEMRFSCITRQCKYNEFHEFEKLFLILASVFATVLITPNYIHSDL